MKCSFGFTRNIAVILIILMTKGVAPPSRITIVLFNSLGVPISSWIKHTANRN